MRILFFGRVADVMGRERDIDLPEGALTLGDLRALLARLTGEDILLRPGVRGSIDRAVAPDETPIPPGAEVAFFSLFSGG